MILRMVMAFLGSQYRGGDRSRTVIDVSNIGTYSYRRSFGLCCSTLKKIFGIAKRLILDDGHSIPRIRRNITYAGRVVLHYRNFPANAEACAEITRKKSNTLAVVPGWNASTCWTSRHLN
jgi:hypothetical protein